MALPELFFHQFRDLSTKLGLASWRHVVELDYDFWAFPGCSKSKMITNRSKGPPLITSVCRESRQLTFDTCRQLPVVFELDNPDGIQPFSRRMVGHPWLDAARDVVHIHWDPEYDIE